MSEKKIDLIAQLLAKAESTTPEEAEALTAAAERLMIKYAIDQAVIDARRAREGKKQEQIITRKVEFSGMYRKDLLSLAWSIVQALGQMRGFRSTGWVQTSSKKTPWQESEVLKIVGFESDVEQAVVLINSLHLQAMVALRKWWNESKDTEYLFHREAARVRARRTFVVYFGHGAGQRIIESRRSVIEEMSSGTDLVLVDRKSRVDEWVEENMEYGKGRASKRKFDGKASGAGDRAGRNAHTGERSMTQGRGLPAGAGR